MSLLDTLRSEGKLDARGSFDLDPEEAREKLRKYQLTNPEKYILQFVQAAIVLGATKLNFQIDSDEVELYFDGESLAREHLEDLFVHAFGRTTDRRMQAAKHLALGVIAAEGVDPSIIEVETGGDEPICLRIAGQNETLEELEFEAERNRIYLKERARVEHLKEFLSRASIFHTRWREPETLEACRYASVPIHVNRDIIATGSDLKPRATRRVEVIDHPTERGFLRYDATLRRPGSLTLIQNGVIIEQTHIELGDFGFEAIVESDRLATNLSYTGFVRNEAWHELVDEVLIPAVCRLYLGNTTRSLHQANRPLMADLTNGLLESWTRLLDRYRTPSPVVLRTLMHISDAEIWRLSTGRVHLARALEMVGEGPIYYTTTAYPEVGGVDEDGRELEAYFVFEKSDFAIGDPRLLARATGRRLIDITQDLQERHRRRIVEHGGNLALLDGVESRWPHALVESTYDRPVTLERDSLAVSVGHDPKSSLGVARFFVKAGVARVQKVHHDIPALNGLTFSVAARTASSVESAMHESAHLIALAVAAYLRVGRLIEGPRERWVPLALAGLIENTFAAEIVEFFGRKDLEPVEFAWHHRNRFRIFEGIDGAWRSIKDLSTPIEYVPASSRTRAVQIAYEVELLEREGIVWLDEPRLTILESRFTKDALVDVEESLAIEARRIQRKRGGLEEEPVLNGTYLLKRSLSGTFKGEVGLTTRWTTFPGAIDLVILHRQKRLATRRLPAPYGHFRAVVDGGVQPREDLGDVVEDQAYEDLVERLESVAHHIFEQHASSRLDSAELEGAAELVLWKAVSEAVHNQTHPYRLEWPVFATNEGMKSYRDLEDRTRVYDNNTGVDAVRIFLPAVPGERPRLLAAIFGDEVEETRGRVASPTGQRDFEPGPFRELRRELATLAPELELEVEDDVQDLRLIARRFSVGKNHHLARAMAKHPRQAAFLLAVWAMPEHVSGFL